MLSKYTMSTNYVYQLIIIMMDNKLYNVLHNLHLL